MRNTTKSNITKESIHVTSNSAKQSSPASPNLIHLKYRHAVEPDRESLEKHYDENSCSQQNRFDDGYTDDHVITNEDITSLSKELNAPLVENQKRNDPAVVAENFSTQQKQLPKSSQSDDNKSRCEATEINVVDKVPTNLTNGTEVCLQSLTTKIDAFSDYTDHRESSEVASSPASRPNHKYLSDGESTHSDADVQFSVLHSSADISTGKPEASSTSGDESSTTSSIRRLIEEARSSLSALDSSGDEEA